VIGGTRFSYDVWGDAVNVAARLEEICRDHECEVIVSATTWELARVGGLWLPDAAAGAVRLRGRDEAVRVFRIGQEPGARRRLSES